MFVHLAPDPVAKRIKLGGIKARRINLPGIVPLRGVYAFPLVPNFQVSHQWLRELKRGGCRTILGVYFRIPDNEEVIVGHYAQKHKWMSAAQASGFLRRINEPLGYQVIIQRKIRAREIHKVRPLPQTIGWRYTPKAHGQAPCGCPICWERGGIKSRKIREEWLDRERDFMDAIASGSLKSLV
jgi:hypothetical protein